MDEITRVKFPGKPLTEEELEQIASITARDRDEAIAAADDKLKEYLEAKRGRSIRSQQ